MSPTIPTNCGRHVWATIHLYGYTVRSGNDVATTFPLEVFAQRNFVADFFDRSLSPCAITWRCLRDPTFSRFSYNTACDR